MQLQKGFLPIHPSPNNGPLPWYGWSGHLDPITSGINDYNALYTGLPSKWVWKLQLVQNAVPQLLSGATWSMWITPMPISYWVQLKVFAITYKTLLDLMPLYLWDCLSPILHLNSFGHLTRASSGATLQMGRINNCPCMYFLHHLVEWSA